MNEENAAAAREVLDRFMAALNRRDETALNDTLHVPHVRLASGAVRTWETPGTYRFADFLGRAGDGWHESRWDERSVIHAGVDKVHFAVVFSRWRADGSLMGRYQSIYVVTRVGGKWGIQARSSFAQ
jgi:hypothetical protein